ncbi:hypothetical protein B0H16DRAFT_1883883 [Mycena metata]|uniref:Uncharacterized protein n=1 Tax=Mycena metata TaxID=1033252 RepID=A0AAD7JE75_9AGAR|nr:hypothetical protein B0H16DRAFT_1883883 [Mycena metata]
MLHDLENTLGEIVAGMFWTRPLDFTELVENSNALWMPTMIEASVTPPTFLQGNATVTATQTRGRLDLSIVAIAAGLTASVILALLSLPSVILKTASQKEIPIDGTGMLYAIWLYRNNLELEAELEQVEHPTDVNLRQAGMDDGNAADALLDSTTTLLRMSREAPPKPRLKSSSTLGLLSLALHSALIVLHLTLIGIWGASLEHRLMFSLDSQKTVSFLITAISQTFGTIYSALLVFVTQTLWMRRSLQVNQTLTAMHDHAAAWTGIGSAMLHIWHQKTATASLTGAFAVFLYLGNILILHISTPALFSLQTFDFTRPLQVETHGLPRYNFGNTSEEWAAAYANMSNYASGSLYYLPSVLGSKGNLGLNGSTLYNVLDLNSGSGNVTVHATGFNMACTYLNPSPDSLAYSGSWGSWVNDSEDWPFLVPSTQPGAPRTAPAYSTIPILDSQNNHPPEVNLNPPMNGTTDPVYRIQLFQCSQSLVNQTAVVDVQSRLLLSVEPEIYKKTSAWLPSNNFVVNTSTGNSFLDLWGAWYGSIPPSDFPRDGNPEVPDFVSVADMYIIQKLNLHPANINDAPNTVMLHDLENMLGEIAAGMFWTPFFRGNAIVTEIQTRGRLDLSIIAVIVAGLTASIVLALLSLPTLILNKTPQKEIPLDGTGMLHAIWLYRNNLDLETELEQVEHPTDENLRQAGMVKLSIIAIAAGLTASVILALLSLPSVILNKTPQKVVSIDGTGMLHAIWLYRNSPELETELEQVEHPTDDNLRQAGMVKVKWTEGCLRRRKSHEAL